MRTALTTPFVVALGFVATAIFAQPVFISPDGQKAEAPDVAICPARFDWSSVEVSLGSP